MQTKFIKEKIIQYGVNQLDHREIISFLTGVDMNRLEYNSLVEIYRNIDFMPITKLQKEKLKSLFRFSTLISSDTPKERLKIDSPDSVAKLVMSEMQYLAEEHLRIVLLNTKNQLLSIKPVTIGTVNSSLVSSREIFIKALSQGAVSFVLIHNHPSGCPKPSEQDILITKKIAEAGQLLNIKLLDHIVIGLGTFASLKQLGYL